jgi:polyisoprenoid-binding protein YceI
MKSKLHHLTLLALAVTLSSCAKNPADDVAKATVEDPNASSSSPAKPSAEARKFVFIEPSTIGFTGSKVTGSHSGGFKKFTGHVTVAGDELAAGDHLVVIDMESTWADHPKLEMHLKSADFFDIETYPETTFNLNSAKKGEGSNYTFSGELTLRGTTKAITFPGSVTTQDEGFHLEAEFSINRKDFNIRYPGKKDDLIRDEVVIALDLLAAPQ